MDGREGSSSSLQEEQAAAAAVEATGRQGGRRVGQCRAGGEGREDCMNRSQGMPRRGVEIVEKDGALGARDVTQQGPRVRCKIDLGWDGNRCDGVGCVVLDEA